jgi:LmbE family N-acetylglucosaminyl deacetylase
VPELPLTHSSPPGRRALHSAVALVLVAAAVVAAQQPTPPPARGAVEAWHRLQKLTTTASLLHTVAHPDDEQGALLAAASRGLGARTILLSITRGESGDNAIGAELFDALGLLRTEELLLAGAHYGLDDLYFTTAADYGYSKRLDEAFELWDRQAVVRDMVRVIRRTRPLVVVSRWQGTARDGHGQHQASGIVTPEAVAAAADPARFPELAAEGLRPWRVRKLYLGGARQDESWTLRLDGGGYAAPLGRTWSDLARAGLAVQRSQTSGRYDPAAPPMTLFYTRTLPAGAEGSREEGLFDGLPTRMADLPRLLECATCGAEQQALAAADDAVDAAVRAFDLARPDAMVALLARGLGHVRHALSATSHADLQHELEITSRQFAEAIAAAAGIEVLALAVAPGADDSGRPFGPLPTLGPLVAGQQVHVRVRAAHRSPDVQFDGAELTAPPATRVETLPSPDSPGAVRATFDVHLPPEAPPTRPSLARHSIAEHHYTPVDRHWTGRAPEPAPLVVTTRWRAGGQSFTVRTTVQRREADLPRGYILRDVEIVPALSVRIDPQALVVPLASPGSGTRLTVTVASQGPSDQQGELTLRLPEGWRATPARHSFTAPAGGATVALPFTVVPPSLAAQAYPVEAVARVNGREYATGVQVIRHEGLGLQYLHRPARVAVHGVDLAIAPGLRVGYVMGVGDEVPAAIAQTGASVQLLGAADLASGDLSAFHVIVTGTRAYAVRPDLRQHNGRLLDYAKAGGHLLVLYNTPEYTPATQAPYPADLPPNAEEVSEEDAPVRLLRPDHPLLTRPNRIGPADFEGWVEQRGSKFFARWDPRYVALLSSHDRGQAPQDGGLLHAEYGRGRYTYMAYALHRQLPAGVPGAYRLLANLLSAGHAAPEGR